VNDFFDGTHVSFITAYLAGFFTFFASCILPLVPTYLGYLSGISFQNLGDKKNKHHILKTASIFVLGFVATFVAMGLVLQRISWALLSYRDLIEKISGIFFLALGLYLLGVFKSNFLSRERQTPLHTFFEKNINLHAFLTGVGFGFSWTPCIGPVLAVILYWSAQAETALVGSLLLASFGIGLGTPFILVSLAFEKIVPALKKYQKISKYISYVAGSVVILFGILLLLGKSQDFSLQIFKFFSLSGKSI